MGIIFPVTAQTFPSRFLARQAGPKRSAAGDRRPFWLQKTRADSRRRNTQVHVTFSRIIRFQMLLIVRVDVSTFLQLKYKKVGTSVTSE